MKDADYLNYINKIIADYKCDGVLIFFTASWCEPCKRTKPLVLNNSEILSQKKIHVVFIDIDTNTDNHGNSAPFFKLLKSKRLVRGVPSLLLYVVETPEHNNIKNIYPVYFCESDTNHFNALIKYIRQL